MKWIAGAACMMGMASLSACAGKPAPPPAPEPAVRPAPPPAIVSPPVETEAEEWRDGPLTPGDWSYDAGTGVALHGEFSLRCDGALRQVIVSRAGASGTLRLRTTFGARLLPPGAAIPADDPLLDELAFSRGRFTVEATGMATLVLPAWPEPARVIEDCRG